MKLTVNVAGRQTAAYAYTGGKAFDPERPCVVFIHGALHDHSVWTLLARWLAHRGYGVLAVDLPAHGRSQAPPLSDIAACADWALALLDAAGVKQAAWVGHSMGSLIALEAAARAPQRAHRLVMIGTAYPMRVSPALLDTARQAPAHAIDRVNLLSHSTLAAKPSYPGPGSWLRGANRALMRRMQSQHADLNLFEHDFRICDVYANGLEAAAAVQAPTTLVLGTADQMTPPKAAADIAAALRAHVVALRGGHSLMQECPDAVQEALRAALT